MLLHFHRHAHPQLAVVPALAQPLHSLLWMSNHGLEISELKWTGMGNLIQMTIISTTVGKNPLGEME